MIDQPDMLPFILASTVGGVCVGWWLCKKIKFGDIERLVHEQRMREKMERRSYIDPFTHKTMQKNVGKTPIPAGAAVSRARGGYVPANVSPVQQQNSGIDPLTGLLILNAVADSSPAPLSQGDDCSPSHDSGGGYDSGSSSSDCGSSSSDSGGGGGGD